MIIHWGRPIPGWLIFGLIVLICLCANFYPPDTRPISPYDYETVTGPEYDSPLNDSLPHYQYTRMKDSLNRVKAEENYFANAKGSSFGLSPLGIASYNIRDREEYFFTIDGYRLNDFVTVENKKDSTILNYPVWDKVNKNGRSGHLETKQTDIKFEAGKETWEGKVLIPVSKNAGTVINIIFIILLIVLGATSLAVVIIIPFRFFLRLAKSQPFTEENIGSLYFTAWFLIGLAVFTSLLKIISHLLFKSQIPSEIEISYYSAIMAQWAMLVVGLAVLLLAKAFLQGMNLREEQDLTI